MTKLIELWKLVHRKLLKISEFFLITLVGISEFWEALFPFKFRISFSISASLTSTKLKLETHLYLRSIAIMLGCFLYFKIAFRVGSLIFRIKGSESGNLEVLRFWTTFERKVFKTLAVSVSVFKIFPFSEKFNFSLRVYRIVKVYRELCFFRLN